MTMIYMSLKTGMFHSTRLHSTRQQFCTIVFVLKQHHYRNSFRENICEQKKNLLLETGGRADLITDELW